VASANELSAHAALESFVPWEEKCCERPTSIPFVCKLSGRERGVSAMVCKMCFVSFGRGEEVAMFGVVAEGSDGGG
jgi:hypothetical protein